MTIHLHVIHGTTTTPFRFARKQIAIGSADDNDLVLKHASVADRHAQLIATTSRFLLSDGGNRTPMSVNGEPAAVAHVLEDGDAITIGAYRIIVFDRAPPGETEAAFLRAIETQPTEAAVRAVYADWLEEQSRPHEAEVIRSPSATPELAALPLSRRRVVARSPIENCDLRFQFKCPKQWAELVSTENPRERYCNLCEKNVHYAPTIEAARRLARRGECVAVDITQDRHPDDLRVHPFAHTTTVGMIAPPDGARRG